MIDIHPDPLHEVRVAKRWALAGVLISAVFLVPVYGILLSLSVADIVFVLAPAGLAAVVAIELASRWEYRMRRRYAYPHRLSYEIATIHEFPRACQRAADIIAGWLKADAVVLAWLADDEESLTATAAYGFPRDWTESAARIQLGTRAVGESIRTGEISSRPADGHPWFGRSFPEHKAIFVPLVSRHRTQGVLAIAARPGNQLTKDKRLLAALGMVTGLALDNCRLYEGQRAHAEHLLEVNRMKTDFLSTISHELRTPLTSIMMAADILREDEEAIDPESPRARLVGNIVKGASRLSSLVADLVNISRDDAFQPRLELDPVPLIDLVTDAAGIIQPLAGAKQQTLKIEIADPGVVVVVDRLRFEQVLINLLSNAQRFTPAGGSISVRHRTTGDEELISVVDSGPGVPPEERERVFEPFFRGDRSGLGLGLAIAKSIVEQHGGRLWVEGREEGGSIFSIALARQAAPARRDVAPAATA